MVLEKALADEPAGAPHQPEIAAMVQESDRLVELSLSRDLPARERARHMIAAAKIAHQRLTACPAGNEDELAELLARWSAAGNGARRNALAENAAGQETLTQLIFDTERETAGICGAPTGDDELLLKLAQHEDQP